MKGRRISSESPLSRMNLATVFSRTSHLGRQQLAMHARGAVDLPAVGMHLADPLGQVDLPLGGGCSGARRRQA